jgi:phospholipid/cholesterol/gamma-HCH transport system substrate-binding protein
METRANFVLIGAFTVAAIVGAFLFVMWIAGYGTPGGRVRYQVIFNGSVSGLTEGALVLFNGLKVGDVSRLSVDKTDPKRVIAEIDVEAGTLIKNDTKARLETQGLTGGAAIELSGGEANAPALEGQNGRPAVLYAGPSQFQTIIDNVENLSGKANSVLDQAQFIISDNSGSIHATIKNAEVFSKALADNAPGINAALKTVADLGKQIEPLASRLQTLSEDADSLVKAIDTDKVRSIVDNAQSVAGKANTFLDGANKLLADNSDAVHSTLTNLDEFAKALGDNASNVDAALKSVADLGKTIQPVAARIQTLSEDADRLVQSIEPDKVRAIVDNAQSLSASANSAFERADKLLADNGDAIHSTLQNVDAFSKVLNDNAPNVDVTLKNLADLSKSVPPLVAQIQTLSGDADRVVKAVEPDQVHAIVANAQSLSANANAAFAEADKLLAENGPAIRSTLQNVDAFSKVLNDNSSNVDATLKGLADLSKSVPPLVAQIQTLSGDADRVVKSVDPDQVHAIVANAQSLSANANAAFAEADKLLAENGPAIRSTLQNVDAFSKVLSDNSPNVDVTLKNLAELSKSVQPVVAQIQTLSGDADRVVKAVDPDQVHAIVVNAETFSRVLADSSNDFRTVMRDGATLTTHLNDTSKRLDSALIDVDAIFKVVDAQKIAGVVDAASDVAETVRQNRGNIDLTLKNFGELSAKLNESADKIDGLIASAQNFLGAPGTKGAVEQVGEAAQSVKKLADDVDVRVKDISVGLSHFSNSGLREYEALAIEGRRTLGDIDNAVRSIERNPSQIIFGSKSSLPEYHGGQ